MSQAVIQGDYVDLRFVKSRKVCQIVIECPIELGQQIVRAFGTPLPDTTIPVALARLNEAAQPKEPERRSFNQLKPSQQAGILCGQGDFRTFVLERGAHFEPQSPEDAVRCLCEVTSRAELDTNSMAATLWQSLRSEFEVWKRV